MDTKEIEAKLYINSMRIKSIEAEMGRVSPFSEDFDILVNESLKLQNMQKKLGSEKIKILLKTNEAV